MRRALHCQLLSFKVITFENVILCDCTYLVVVVVLAKEASIILKDISVASEIVALF
jgi:hypothetical protein